MCVWLHLSLHFCVYSELQRRWELLWMFILLSIRNTVLVVAFSWIWRLVTLKPKQPRRVGNNKAQFILNLYCARIQFPINCEIEVRFTNKNLLSVNARPNCRKNKQLILSNDTRLFFNNCFLLKSQEKHCMTIDVFQHGLPSVNPFFVVFFFPQFAFCILWPSCNDHKWWTKCRECHV